MLLLQYRLFYTLQIINIIKLKNISHLVVYFIFLTFSLLGDTQNIVKNIYVELDLEGNTYYRKKAIDRYPFKIL